MAVGAHEKSRFCLSIKATFDEPPDTAAEFGGVESCLGFVGHSIEDPVGQPNAELAPAVRLAPANVVESIRAVIASGSVSSERLGLGTTGRRGRGRRDVRRHSAAPTTRTGRCTAPPRSCRPTRRMTPASSPTSTGSAEPPATSRWSPCPEPATTSVVTEPGPRNARGRTPARPPIPGAGVSSADGNRGSTGQDRQLHHRDANLTAMVAPAA